jgi:SHS2 domain-containing protein
MEHTSAGFREIEHTADWQINVWAPDLTGLLEQAARGLYSLAGARLEEGPRRLRVLEIKGEDAETLLVRFLSELLYIAEQENLGFDEYDFNLRDKTLTAQLSGAQLASWSKEIKAVTYHNIKVQSSPQGLEVNIVFDV